MCPTQTFCRDTVTEEVRRMAEAGIDYIQLLDQNHGGTPYLCYARNHGHPPVPGRWASDAMLELLQEAREAASSSILFGCESAASEVFIPDLPFSDNRFELNFILGMPVPLYAYLYHPYVNNFMGNQVCGEGAMDGCRTKDNLQYRLAYAFAAGDFLTLVINDEGLVQWAWGQQNFDEAYMPDGDTAIRLARNLNAWRTGAGRKYLHTGRMIRPLEVTGAPLRELATKAGIRSVPAVLTARYEASDGEKGQFLVNYTTEPVAVRLPEGGGMRLITDPSGKGKSFPIRKAVTVPALSALLIEE